MVVKVRLGTKYPKQRKKSPMDGDGERDIDMG